MCRDTRFFVSNTSLKLVKNEAKAKLHPQAESFTIRKLFAFFIHVIIQKNKCKLTICKLTSVPVSIRLYDLL